MYFTGFSDEAGQAIDLQIKATKELGWKHIELRNTDGPVNVSDVSDAKFDEVLDKLGRAGISISCFGSAVANWAKDPLKEEDFQKSIQELERCIPRMKRAGTRYLRGMSFFADKSKPAPDKETEKTIFRKVGHLVKMCEDAGILYLHENCLNYGGLSSMHTLRLLDAVNSPSLRLIFDTGNPPGLWDRSSEEPWKKQDPFKFYKDVRKYIEYVHIKDGIFKEEGTGIFPDVTYTFPGEGNGKVREIVTDLLKTGYEGGFSIEPHLAVVFHDAKTQDALEDEKYRSYVEYGRRFMKLVEECRALT